MSALLLFTFDSVNPTFLRRVGAFLITCALGLSLGACETELDANDSYRETAIVYAILDPRQTDANGQPVQRISINKAFLNAGANAIDIAATQPDSVTFPNGVIEARLEFVRPDSSVKISYPLLPVPNTDKLPGAFAREGQLIYQTPAGFPGLDTDTAIAYRVVARNLRTGAMASGATNIPLVADPNNPGASGNYLFFKAAYTSLRRENQFDPTTEFDPAPQFAKPRIAFQKQPRAGIYSVELDFRFFEIIGTDTVPQKLTWQIATNIREAYSATQEVSFQLENDAFFNDFLLRKINFNADAPGLRRVVANPAITFRVTAGSPQWARYQEILGASSALTQVTPEYTNVRGGRGLVTGRVQHEVRQRITTSKGRPAFARFPRLKFDI